MNTKYDYEKWTQELQKAYQEEAGNLLSTETIEDSLEQETARLERARILSISPSSYMGMNPQRYCKDLVRRSQPGFILYYLLGLLTEGSTLLLLWSALCAFANALWKISFPQEIQNSTLYACSIIAGYFLFRTIKQHQLRTFLLTQKDSAPSILLPGLLGVLFAGLTCYTIAAFHLTDSFHLSWWSAFLLYACFLMASGIHNVIYSSHALDFFSITRCLLHPAEANQRAERIALYLTHNTNNDQNKTALRSRLVTNRVYYFLGFLIATALSITSLLQLLGQPFSLSMLICTILALAASILFLALVWTTNQIIGQCQDTPL